MDDVDRLFWSFKCGVSIPQSAFRERRTGKKDKSKKVGSISKQEVSTSGSGAKSKQNASDLQLNEEEFGSTEAKKSVCRNGKHISPIVFYGTPNGVPPKKPASLLRLLREIRSDIYEQNKLREEVWATFPRQEEAMKYAKRHTLTRVFSYQDHMNGQRRFLVSTYKEFWRRYKNMNPKWRHHYEVIQEGLPCHLYFDLEYEKSENAEKNGDEMVDILISVIFEALFDKYSIQGDHDWIVELDSSTKQKFSRHLVIRLPKTAFKNNLDAGAFVAEICSRIHSLREKDERFEKLFVHKDSRSQLFVDTAVYSRNRCFRLHLSSKAGKSSVLLPTRRFKCKNMSEEEVFMAALICNMDNDCEKLLICKMDLDCVKALHFDTEINSNFLEQSDFPGEFVLSDCTNEASGTYSMGKSPFPALDVFVETVVASIGNVRGKIRSWYWFSEYGLIVYSMLRNRFCERIGRQHKSNHVMYVFDLRRAAYYQKCHDPDCRGYRSPLRPIPTEILPDCTVSADSEVDKNITSCDNDAISITDSCKRDARWWLEAIRVADGIENIQKSLDLTIMDEVCSEDDDEWWMAVEKTASLTEMKFFEQN